MPFKNTSEFLPECINSILGQSETDWELGEIVRVLNQKRDMAYLPLLVDDFRSQVTVTEEDIEIRYDEESNRYMTDLAADVEYLLLDVDDLVAAGSYEVSEEEILAQYEDERNAALGDEQRDSSHILVQVHCAVDFLLQ